MNDQSTLNPTGFEHKILRVVIENWLYTQDLDVLMSATTELRRRFKKTFPCPDWAKQDKKLDEVKLRKIL